MWELEDEEGKKENVEASRVSCLMFTRLPSLLCPFHHWCVCCQQRENSASSYAPLTDSPPSLIRPPTRTHMSIFDFSVASPSRNLREEDSCARKQVFPPFVMLDRLSDTSLRHSLRFTFAPSLSKKLFSWTRSIFFGSSTIFRYQHWWNQAITLIVVEYRWQEHQVEYLQVNTFVSASSRERERIPPFRVRLTEWFWHVYHFLFRCRMFLAVIQKSVKSIAIAIYVHTTHSFIHSFIESRPDVCIQTSASPLPRSLTNKTRLEHVYEERAEGERGDRKSKTADCQKWSSARLSSVSTCSLGKRTTRRRRASTATNNGSLTCSRSIDDVWQSFTLSILQFGTRVVLIRNSHSAILSHGRWRRWTPNVFKRQEKVFRYALTLW